MGKVSNRILLSLIDSYQPFCMVNKEIKTGDILNLLINGIKVKNGENIIFNRLFLITTNDKNELNIAKNIKQCLNAVNKISNKTNIKFLNEDKDLSVLDEDKANNFSYLYAKIGNILVNLHGRHPEYEIYVNLSTGNILARLCLSLFTYNMSEDLKQFIFSIYNTEIRNDELYKMDLIDFNAYNVKNIIDFNYKDVVMNYIDNQYFLNINTLIDNGMLFPNENFLACLKAVKSIYQDYDFNSAIKLINSNKKLKNYFLNDELINLVNDSSELKFTSISKIISVFICLKKFFDNEYTNFT